MKNVLVASAMSLRSGTEPADEGEEDPLVEPKNSWRKVSKKKPKAQTPAQAAMDILGGSGGVLDRSDALGQGVASDKRRR